MQLISGKLTQILRVVNNKVHLQSCLDDIGRCLHVIIVLRRNQGFWDWPNGSLQGEYVFSWLRMPFFSVISSVLINYE